MNASGGVPGCAMIQHSKDIKKQTSHEKYRASYLTIMQSNMTMNVQVIYMMMMESCMAIYLEMAMEMP